MAMAQTPRDLSTAGRLPTWAATWVPVLVVVLSVLVRGDVPGPRPVGDGVSLAIMAADAGAIALRRRVPRSAAAVTVAVMVACLALNGPFASCALAVVITVYTVARHVGRQTAAVLALAAAVGFPLAVTWLEIPGAEGLQLFVEPAAFLGLAAAAGDAARSRAAYLQAITDRAIRAETARESEARRRVAEERLRIARDLHDVLAHQIAVINLQANVASQALQARPEDAERSLTAIREAGRTVLGEIQGLLRVLRSTDPDVPAAIGTAPVPGLTDLDSLVASFERSGLRVDRRTGGLAVDVPAAVGAAAYRIVQEALTNAHKHGSDSSAFLQLDYGDDELEVTVTNTVTSARDSSDLASRAEPFGHGLMGARERAAAVRGQLDTSVGPGPVHRLTAQLPLRDVDGGAITMGEIGRDRAGGRHDLAVPGGGAA